MPSISSNKNKENTLRPNLMNSHHVRDTNGKTTEERAWSPHSDRPSMIAFANLSKSPERCWRMWSISRELTISSESIIKSRRFFSLLKESLTLPETNPSWIELPRIEAAARAIRIYLKDITTILGKLGSSSKERSLIWSRVRENQNYNSDLRAAWLWRKP